MFGKLFDSERMFDNYINRKVAEAEERARRKIYEKYLIPTINNNFMSKELFCSTLDVSDDILKEIAFESIQKGLVIHR